MSCLVLIFCDVCRCLRYVAAVWTVIGFVGVYSAVSRCHLSFIIGYVVCTVSVSELFMFNCFCRRDVISDGVVLLAMLSAPVMSTAAKCRTIRQPDKFNKSFIK